MLLPSSTALRLPHNVIGAAACPDVVATKSSWYRPGARTIVSPGCAAASACASCMAVETEVLPGPAVQPAAPALAGGEPGAPAGWLEAAWVGGAGGAVLAQPAAARARKAGVTGA